MAGIEIDGKPIKNTLDGSELAPLKSNGVGRHSTTQAIANLAPIQLKDKKEIDETDFTAGIYTVAAADMNKYIIADLTASGADRTIKIQNASVGTEKQTVVINYKAGSVQLTVTTVGGTQLLGDATSQVITKSDENVTFLDNATEFLKIQDSRINSASVDLTREPETDHITTLDDALAHIGSPFIGEGAQVTDNGDGTVTITEAEAWIKTSNSVDASFKSVVVAEDTLTIAAETNITLYIDYNAGNPIYAQKVAVAGYFFTNWDETPFATVVNTGTEIKVNEFCDATTNQGFKMALSQANYEPFRYVGGLATSEIGTRNIVVTAGYAIFIFNGHPIASINTSVADTFTNVYYNGSAWIRTASQTTINNTQYNDVATGMVSLSNNKFANKYLYYIKDSPNYWMILEGQEEYGTLSEAEDAGIPSALPPELNTFYAGSLLVSVLVVKQGQATIRAILNPFVTPFTSSAASSHQNLSDLLFAELGVTYGHINDQAQQIKGLKELLDGIISNTVYGGDGVSDDLTLESTSDPTKGDVKIQPNGGMVGVGTTPISTFHVKSGGTLPLRIDNNLGVARCVMSLTNDDADIFLYDRSDILQIALRSEGVSYVNQGSLGIGNNSPSFTLDVTGTFGITTTPSIGTLSDPFLIRNTSGEVKQITLSLAGSGVTNGLVDDQSQSLAGAKTWLNNQKFKNQILFDTAISGTQFQKWTSGDLDRWVWEKTGTESGANAGANLTLYRYDDAGALISFVVSFNRATGAVNFYNGVTVASLTVSNVPSSATITHPVLYRNSSTGAIEQYIQLKQASIASASSITPTGDAKENEHYITALAANATFAAPSGTPANGNNLMIRITSDATPRTLTWNAIYSDFLGTLPSTTVASKTMYINFIYNSTSVKWEHVSTVQGV